MGYFVVVDKSPDSDARVNVSRNAFFQLALCKKSFFDVDIVVKKQIEMWFSVFCTLIDNDRRHRSGQNLLWTHSAAPGESTTF